MTEQQLADRGPAFAAFLGRFAPLFDQRRTRGHLRASCRGSPADLPRASAGPLAPMAGTAARPRQEVLTTATGDRRGLRDDLRRRRADALPTFPADGPGTTGRTDETGAPTTGTTAPGGQRQHLGGVGAVGDGTAAVHLAVARGRFEAPRDADLSLPAAWGADRGRGRKAPLPDDVRYPPTWPVAPGQSTRAARHRRRFDGRTFEDGEGGRPRRSAPPDFAEQPYGAEVPVALAGRRGTSGKAPRAGAAMAGPAARREPWRRFRRRRQTGAAAVWAAKALPIRRSRAAPAPDRRLVARDVRTGEPRYAVANVGPRVGRERGLRVALVRWTVEPCSRAAESAIGPPLDVGRSYVGLMRPPLRGPAAPTFVARRAERRPGEEPGGGAGARVPGPECRVRGA